METIDREGRVRLVSLKHAGGLSTILDADAEYGISGDGMEPPSREEVRERLDQLLAGLLTREEASRWALQYLLDEDCVSEDPAVEEAIENLVAADSMVSRDAYFHSEADFQEWRNSL